MSGDTAYWRGFLAGAGLPVPEGPPAARVLDALIIAVDRHIHASADSGTGALAVIASDALRGLRAADPDLFVELACAALDIARPAIDIDAYIAWRDRQEQSDG